MDEALLVATLTAGAAAGTRILRRNLAARSAMDALIGAFSSTFAGWRPDPWPQGVQEEDRERPWGRGRAAQPSEEAPPPIPPLSAVQPRVRAR